MQDDYALDTEIDFAAPSCYAKGSLDPSARLRLHRLGGWDLGALCGQALLQSSEFALGIACWNRGRITDSGHLRTQEAEMTVQYISRDRAGGYSGSGGTDAL